MKNLLKISKLFIIGACFLGMQPINGFLTSYRSPKYSFPQTRRATPLEQQMLDEVDNSTLTEEKLKKYLNNDNFNMNAYGNNGYHLTALMSAAVNSNVELGRLLLQYGAQVNEQNKRGLTALAVAINNGNKNGSLPFIKLLLAHGADPNLHDRQGQSPLMNAAFHGHMEIVKLLLATNKVNLDAQDQFGKTALMFAAHEPVIFKLLLEHCANIDARDDYGWTGLMKAFRQGDVNAVITFLDGGANPNLRSYHENIVAEKFKEDPEHTDLSKDQSEKQINQLANKTFYDIARPLGAQDSNILKALTRNEQRRQAQKKAVLEHTNLLPDLANIVLAYTPAPPTAELLATQDSETKEVAEEEKITSDRKHQSCCIIC